MVVHIGHGVCCPAQGVALRTCLCSAQQHTAPAAHLSSTVPGTALYPRYHVVYIMVVLFHARHLQDNGGGMPHKDIPLMLGRVLSGTKYGVKQTRGTYGQQGLKAAVQQRLPYRTAPSVCCIGCCAKRLCETAMGCGHLSVQYSTIIPYPARSRCSDKLSLPVSVLPHHAQSSRPAGCLRCLYSTLDRCTAPQ